MHLSIFALIFINIAVYCSVAKKEANTAAQDPKHNHHKIYSETNNEGNEKNVSINKDKEITTKSTVVRPNTSLGQQLSPGSQLGDLYRQRLQAVEKVDSITKKIESILQRQYQLQRSSYANAVASFSVPGTPHRYTLGSRSNAVRPAMKPALRPIISPQFWPGNISPATTSPGNAQLRQLAVKMSKHHDQSAEYNAPRDMPQPMEDPIKDASIARAQQDDHMEKADLGDPRVFDKVCSVLKLTFEKTNGQIIQDGSPEANDAKLEDGAYVYNSGSGMSAALSKDGYVQIQNSFKGKPKDQVAIAMWVKLDDVDGVNSLFKALDRNGTEHYDLSVVDGRALWLHRDDADQELFNVKARKGPRFTSGEWHHLAGTYSSESKEAALWVDGQKVGYQKGVSGELSQGWRHLYMFEGKTSGAADNVLMFRCPLDRSKIIALYVSSASPKHFK